MTKPTPKPKMLTADAFAKKAKKRRTAIVDLPALGGAVKIQNLTVGEYDECVELAKIKDTMGRPVYNDAGGEAIDEGRFATLCFLAALVEPEVTPEMLGSIDDLHAGVFTHITACIRELSGIQEGAVSELERRFPPPAE
jgi:hypothetical protein